MAGFIKKSSKKVGLFFLDIPKLVGWKHIKTHNRYIAESAKQLFIPRAAKGVPAQHNNFEQVMQAFNLSEEALRRKRKELQLLLGLCLILAVLIFPYSIYLAISSGVLAAMLAFTLGCLSLALAFRYHFWLFQIKQRRLGCTFKEWFNDLTHKGNTNEKA